VLGEFNRAQKQELDELLDYTAQAVESIIAEGVEKSMTKFNRRAPGSTNEEE
jgi:PTH1 family peptidyl-tRNA hydrolase